MKLKYLFTVVMAIAINFSAFAADAPAKKPNPKKATYSIQTKNGKSLRTKNGESVMLKSKKFHKQLG